LISNSQKRRLLIVSLDGLSVVQLHILSSHCPNLASILNSGQVVAMHTEPVNTPQPVWAEVLTGKSWFDLGCSGYSRPGASLMSLEVVSEENLSEPFSLINGDLKAQSLIVNMPLVMPGEGRCWLADGSLPLQITVSPNDLASKAPFDSYQPRAYLSSILALAHKDRGGRDALQVERDRLRLSLELTKTSNWSSCLVRFSVFDQLAHLYGADYLDLKTLLVRSDLEEFLAEFDVAVKQMVELFSDSIVCIVSAFSHTPCHARLNLNELLVRGGFCCLESGDDSDRQVLERRAHALTAISTARAGSSTTSDMVSASCKVNAAASLAASPVAGAIYLNRQDRFEDGTVTTSKAGPVLNDVFNYVHCQLQESFGAEVVIWKNETGSLNAPDLMVYIPGVELHDSADRTLIDRVNKPRSTHIAEGFAWLAGKGGYTDSVISPTELHSALKERLS